MSIWLVTIGNSDVQLQKKNHWDKAKLRQRIPCLTFEPDCPKSEPLCRVPARALGIAYSDRPDELWQDLRFPLLKAFTAKLKGELEQTQTSIDRIIVLLTDQTRFFTKQEWCEDTKNPYWRDTCTLEPILERYLRSQFDAAKLTFCTLQPRQQNLDLPEAERRGLDDWDEALEVVKPALLDLQLSPTETVYVSHQASTPAISAAVQFMSLALFRHKVDLDGSIAQQNKIQFLVSNEYTKRTSTIDDSRYLRELQRQEALALLDRYDYAGVQELLSANLDTETDCLLKAAIQWNYAEFEKFANILKSAEFQDAASQELVEAVKERSQVENWWWTAYESAWLGVVRLEQGNTTEAMFHSFRAVEGLLREWAETKYTVQYNNKGKPFVSVTDKKAFNLFGQPLYNLLEYYYQDKKNGKPISKCQNRDIWQFGQTVFDRRNNLFHQLKGLEDRKAVFAAWDISIEADVEEKEKAEEKAEVEWKNRVLGCLNFVSGQSFVSLEEASLMAQVHEKLRKSIASTR